MSNYKCKECGSIFTVENKIPTCLKCTCECTCFEKS